MGNCDSCGRCAEQITPIPTKIMVAGTKTGHRIHVLRRAPSGSGQYYSSYCALVYTNTAKAGELSAITCKACKRSFAREHGLCERLDGRRMHVVREVIGTEEVTGKTLDTMLDLLTGVMLKEEKKLKKASG